MAAARAKAWAQLRDVNLLRLIHPRLGVPFRVMTLSVEQRLCVASAAALSVIVATVLGAILWLCDGHLIYSLDDPYISLALGWHIGHGHYGINAGEAASPASSILYPFLLAAFAWASWQQWVPFIVNAAAAIGTGVAFGAAFCRYGILTRPNQVARGCAVVVALCLAINLVGLVFTGLEHSLHALTSVFVVLALARALEEDRVPASLVVAVVLLPLFRFEGIALASLITAALLALGHRRAAGVMFAGIAVCVGGYMAALHAVGLPPLPASVLVKSDIASNAVDASRGFAGLLHSIVVNAIRSFNVEAVPAFVLMVWVAAHPVVRWCRGDRRDGRRLRDAMSLRHEFAFAAVVVGAIAAHMLFGRWGEFARYEIYAVALGAASVVVLWSPAFAYVVAHKHAWPFAATTVGMLCIGWVYVGATLATPLAARGIYEQQYQMHRFAIEFYREPIGVNDLGWVSYRNPYYVLDLAGLASDAARRARTAEHRSGDWMSRMVEAKHVGLVMIYDQWFAGQIPAGWRRLAMLQVPHALTARFNTVSFYATSRDAAEPAMGALRAFSRDLIPGTSLTILDEPRS